MRRPIYERLRRELYERELRAQGYQIGLLEAYAEKLAETCPEASSEILNALAKLMRSYGFSLEEIDAITIKAAMLNS